jgi:hypothetical protein
MPGAVRIAHGDLFDRPADLVVLPCSTEGTFTQIVAARLAEFSIPQPEPMGLGEVRIRPLEDATQVAQFAAFAASVKEFGSTGEAIARIGQALGEATRDTESIRIVNAPLLGTGAGRLAPDVAAKALTDGFLDLAAPAAMLNLWVLHQDAYEAVLSAVRSPDVRPRPERAEQRTDERRRQPDQGSPLRVLISYSSKSPEHQLWIDTLYRFLRDNGIDARLDTYSLRAGGDVVQWMCNELALADRVLLVCDERYARRADGRLGGVGWETMLVQGDLFASMYGAGDQDAGSKYVPIVLTADINRGRPQFLATKRVIHWPPRADTEELRRELLKELYEVRSEPPLGPPPAWLTERGAPL